MLPYVLTYLAGVATALLILVLALPWIEVLSEGTVRALKALRHRG